MPFVRPEVSDSSPESNIEWNRQRWGQPEGWTGHDHYGYRWGGGFQQTVGLVAAFCDEFLRPWTNGRYDLDIIELAPGAGRFTAELIRYASRLCLVDLNPAAIAICKDRFQYYPTEITFIVNDGVRIDRMVDGDFDVFASYDSMVHMHPEVIERYVSQLGRLLKPGGLAWLDHSGRGQTDKGHRTAMTAELMVTVAERHGLEVLSQRFRNGHDCVTILQVPA